MHRAVLGAVTSFCILVLMLSSTAQAEALALEKRSRIELRAGLSGLKNERAQVTQTEVEVVSGKGGFQGGLAYSYWIRENVALGLSASILLAESKTQTELGAIYTHNVTIVPALLALRFYLHESDLKSAFRPYAEVGLGSFVASVNKAVIGDQIIQESKTQTSLGGFAGAGLDFQISHFLMVGTRAGYHFISDYSDSMGGRVNYSGPEINAGLSFLFGKGVGE
jgi:outer membrane protein W